MTVSTIFTGHFAGKHVVVTGAAAGIGLAIARGFAQCGAAVRLVDLSETVHEAARLARADGLDITSAALDVTDDGAMREFFQQVGSDFGKLDVLVSNAGIIVIDPLEDTTTADFERVLRVNTVAQYIAAREAAPLLRKAGGGSIINAASAQARQGFIYTPGYAASKFGVLGLT